MPKTVNKPTAVGREIASLRGRELCEFIIKLCDCVKKDAGTGFRGGIYPSNIFLSNDGVMSLGPAKEYDWEGEELDFIAPELYWNSRRGPASDVYSIGLIMYYAFSGGRIPYEGETADPVLRRMTNDSIPMPEAAGERMGEIISKALKFRTTERYQSVDELKAVVSSCNTSLFLNDVPTSEAVLNKSEDELTTVERMMVDIIESLDDAAPLPEKEKLKYLQPEKPVEKKSAKKAATPARPTELPSEPVNRVRVGSEGEKKGAKPAVQYATTNMERERKLEKELRRRRRRPVIVILLMCVLLLGGAFVFNRLVNEGQGRLDAEIEFNGIMPEEPSPSPDDDIGSVLVVAPPSESVEPTEEPIPREHTYELYIEDLSWTDARARCQGLGGHLVVINDAEELNTVIALCEENGVYQTWIGCYRDNNSLVWVNGDSVTFYQWGKGEPSAYDYNDDVAEDYVLLWRLGGTWQYNDSRNDPVADYPGMYSGKLAYICEYE